MDEDNKVKNITNRSNMNFYIALTVIFIALKICKVINWSWLWVFSPVIFMSISTFIILLVSVIIVGTKRKK